MGNSSKNSRLSYQSKLIAITLPTAAAAIIPLLLSLIGYWASFYSGVPPAVVLFLYLLVTLRYQTRLLHNKRRVDRQRALYRASVISVFITTGLSQILVFLNRPDAVFSNISGLLLVVSSAGFILSYGFLWWHTLSNAFWLRDIKLLKRLGEIKLLRAFPYVVIVIVNLVLALYLSLVGETWV